MPDHAPDQSASAIPSLLTVAQFAERYPWASVGSLRNAIFYCDSNDFGGCFLRFGKKILLDEARVIDWMRDAGPSGRPIRGMNK